MQADFHHGLLALPLARAAMPVRGCRERPGVHAIEVLVNGNVEGRAEFTLMPER